MAKNPPEYMQAYMQERRSTIEGKEEAKAISENWRKNNPEKYKEAKKLQMRRLRAEKKAQKEAESQKETPPQQ